MSEQDINKMIRQLQESITTFNKQQTHTIPVMDGFIKRHVIELYKIIEILKHSVNK